MPKLSPILKNRVARHLGYSRPRGVAPTLLQIFNQNCNQLLSNDDIYATTGQSVVVLLNRCDVAFKATDFTDSSAFSQFQQVLGDVNRQTRTLTIDDVIGKARDLYYIACDDLAKFINVPNLQRTEVAERWFNRLGEGYVQVAPNVPDTCVSDRLYLSRRFI
jgi:hypothetical protein